MTNIMAATESY